MVTAHKIYQEQAYLKRSGHHRLDETEVDDDLVEDMTEIMTSFCSRLYGCHSARNRARRALEAAGD